MRFRTLEADLGAELERSLELMRFAWYHTHDSRHSPAGFPDYVIASDELDGILHVELKAEGGTLSAAQEWWLASLARADQRALLVVGDDGLGLLFDLLVAWRRAGNLVVARPIGVGYGTPGRLGRGKLKYGRGVRGLVSGPGVAGARGAMPAASHTRGRSLPPLG